MGNPQDVFVGTWIKPTKYLLFDRVDNPGRKTMIWEVVSQSGDFVLGRIAWYGAWRQYCFYPTPETVFNADCLVAITEAVATCNRWQRNIRANLAAANV